MTNTATDEYWADAIGLTEDLDAHEVEAEKFCDVFAQPDGSVVFDEGWQQAWIESDTVVEVRR